MGQNQWRMKKHLLLFIVSAALLSGCKKEEEKPEEFFITYHNNLFTIPQATPVNVSGEYEIKMLYTNTEELFRMGGNVPSDKIIETKVSTLEVAMYSAHYQKPMVVDFLKSVTVYMKADGLPEIEVGSIDSIADGLEIVNLPFITHDVGEYLKKPTLKLRAKAITDKAIANDLYLEVNVGFRFLHNR
jgi:hypothetical protein